MITKGVLPTNLKVNLPAYEAGPAGTLPVKINKEGKK
jgi:hypothetical protein